MMLSKSSTIDEPFDSAQRPHIALLSDPWLRIGYEIEREKCVNRYFNAINYEKDCNVSIYGCLSAKSVRANLKKQQTKD